MGDERNSKAVRIEKDLVSFLEFRHEFERHPPVRYQVELLLKKDADFMRAYKHYLKDKGGD